MNEIRKDSLIERYVIIASERMKRPESYSKTVKKPTEKVCFFCPSNEHMTPPEIDRISAGDEWIVRCFPNKFPVTYILNGKGTKNSQSMPAHGKHEIIVESPGHDTLLHQLSLDHLMKVFDMYQRRIDAIEKIKGVKYVSLFKNQGKNAGASLYHSHTQLIGIPLIPKLIAEEIESSNGKCKICKIGEDEMKTKRKIYADDNTIAYTPYASRFPFEVWIQPRRHVSRLNDMTEQELRSFVSILKNVLGRLNDLQHGSPYNFYIHHSPKGGDLHFHLELCPKFSIIAGFELSSCMYINTMPPENAAKYYQGGRI